MPPTISMLLRGSCILYDTEQTIGYLHMGVSKNRGKTLKWMVYFMENPIKMDDLGFHPYFWKHPYLYILLLLFIHCFMVDLSAKLHSH